jgi:hypothetical protein
LGSHNNFFAGYKTKIGPQIPKSVKKGPQMDTNLPREWTRLRQAYGAAGYEWTRRENFNRRYTQI